MENSKKKKLTHNPEYLYTFYIVCDFNTEPNEWMNESQNRKKMTIQTVENRAKILRALAWNNNVYRWSRISDPIWCVQLDQKKENRFLKYTHIYNVNRLFVSLLVFS